MGLLQGWDVSAQNAMPHAYKGGSQTELLKAQIMAMPQGGTFAMVAPPNPYRCPPGPYERISMVAHTLKEINPTAKILIADPKENFSKQAFVRGRLERHITPVWSSGSARISAGRMSSVDPQAMTLTH